MNNRGRTQLALGVILILLGAWFLADKSVPAFHKLFDKYTDFPFNMFVIGAGIFIVGLVLGQPGMSVPAAIVAGIGGIFYYQEMMKDYASWSYMWTLIPGFVGVGSVLAGLLGDSTSHNLKRGLNLMVVSAVLFLGLLVLPRRMDIARQLWPRHPVDPAWVVGAWQGTVSLVPQDGRNNMRNSQLFWGVILLLVGGFMLASEIGNQTSQRHVADRTPLAAGADPRRHLGAFRRFSARQGG